MIRIAAGEPGAAPGFVTVFLGNRTCASGCLKAPLSTCRRAAICLATIPTARPTAKVQLFGRLTFVAIRRPVLDQGDRLVVREMRHNLNDNLAVVAASRL